MNVPFLDLKLQYQSIKDEIGEAIQQVLDSCAFAGGPFVEKFEAEFAAYCGVKHAVAVGNGTDALWVPMVAAGIGQGDEVITVPSTFIATAEAISLCGATPVFVDVDERTFNMDPAKIEAAITPRTKAILPVHLYGQPADMDPILELARKRGLLVFEDAAQAHGARYKGRGVGTMGLAAGFSFYPGKNLGAYGEAGASITNDDDLARKMRVFRDHGQQRKYLHSMIGWNGRMDGIQAAVLSVKLKYIDGWNEARRSHAATYRDLLGDVESIVLPEEADFARHVYHVFSARTDDRDGLLKHMAERKVGCAIHYPIPIHLQEAYAHLGLGQGSFPVAERCSREIISLPMFPELTQEQLECVAGEVRGFLSQSGSLPRTACAGA